MRARNEKKGGGETFRSVDLMNLKLRRRLFVGLLFCAACTQGRQTQRNKIPRYVCAAYGRRTYGYELNVFAVLRGAYGTALRRFFLSLYRVFFHRNLPPAPWYHRSFVKRNIIIFRSLLDTAVCEITLILCATLICMQI